jgi:hypothetical protein
MKIELYIKNTENVGEITEEKKKVYAEIFEALIASGGLDGVKGGKTILHFDANAIFQQVQLDYVPWRRKRLDTTNQKGI